MKSAPPGAPSLLALWHEAGGAAGHGGGPAGIYPPSVTGPALKAAQKHVQRLARDHGCNVRVGAIEVVGHRHVADWMARDLDFYGCDIYDNAEGSARPSVLLDAFADRCAGISGKPVITVCETNSRFAQRRPHWFRAVWSWLHQNTGRSAGTGMLTYWNDAGLESGRWRPADDATIRELDAIFAQASP